jgi:hypothetical protein
MPANSIERYRLYVIIGIIFSIISEWITSGTQESPKEMAALTIHYLNKSIL